MTGLEVALVSGMLKDAGSKLGSLLSSEVSAITSVKKDLFELKDMHDEITGWLLDRAKESGEPRTWVNKLRNVAYDIDDLLYEVHLEGERHKLGINAEKKPIAAWFTANPKHFLFRCKVAHKIKAIKVTYSAIVKQRSDANTISKNPQMDHPVRNNWTAREMSILSNVEDSKIPRRDQENDEIVRMILEHNEGEDGRPTIVSIVGLGGSGKTTLAKHVCHDKNIKKHFNDTIFWVYVSEQFDMDKLIGKLFQAITKQKSDLSAQEHMLSEISKKIRADKFLLVLDDAWHQEKFAWDQFTVHLKSGAPGSKVLLTTRDRKVAEIVKSRHIFELGFLSEAESWSLFLKISGLVEDNLGPEYIHVGKEILNRCGGVPLAIKTLGGILCEKQELSTWRAIRDSDLWTDDTIKDSVFACLKLSFIHLADELKQCFTFCSIFPKGYRIYKDRLIAQWIAHGFISAMNEDIGSRYFDSLAKVGFLQGPSIDWDKQIVCTMHDLIHDLTRHILQGEVVTCLPNNMATDYTQRYRYLSLTSCGEKVDRASFDRVHALYISEGNPKFDKPVKKSSCMRSVVLDYTNRTSFPPFILKFEYIGYLEIHDLSCAKLPEAITGCWNLQSLNFINCKYLVTLPESIGKLKKLRTLELCNATDLENLPQSIGDCHDLQSLNLHSCGKVREIPSTICQMKKLRALHISNCSSLKQLPSEFTGEFCKLQTINLSGCQKFKNLPSTLSCPMLSTLDLSETKVTKLPPWVTETSTLECINLESCMKLVELPKDIGNLKRLEVLNIEGCFKLRDIPMPSGIGQLTRLRQLGLFIVGCDKDDASISELESLDRLSGSMEITYLKYVKDPCEAEKACLKRKNNIKDLKLYWQCIWRRSSSGTEEELAPDVKQEQGVLNALEPPSQIKCLEIRGYRGLYLPRWMMKQNDSTCCEGTLPKQTSPCQFLYLSNLQLSALTSLKHMRGLLVFPSLKWLFLWRMDNLEELWTTTSGFKIEDEASKAQNCFPSLYKLHIKGCPKLVSVKPYFPPSLEKLYLQGHDSLQLLSPGNFSHVLRSPNASSSSCSVHSVVPHLRKLNLTEMRGASSGWEFLQHCTELETLEIEDCNDLTKLPESIQSLTSLRKLRILSCHTLAGLPESLGALRFLKLLHVRDTPKITGLPESMKHLTALEELDLQDCAAPTILPEWIGQLSDLRHLTILRCSGLQCLPQSMQSLTALQQLTISGCGPDFARRYKKEEGPDWHLVSHIDHVDIDNIRGAKATTPCLPGHVDVAASNPWFQF